MTSKSVDRRGRTLSEILIKKDKDREKPLDVQDHNPLRAKKGCTVSFDGEPQFAGVAFFLEKLSVYETRIGAKTFYHSDYHLKGVGAKQKTPLRLRLRLIPDDETPDKLGYRIQLLHLYHEMGFDKDFVEMVLADATGEIRVLKDDEGNALEMSRRYWRVEDVLDPYHAHVSTLSFTGGDDQSDGTNVDREDVTYYDYSRLTEGEAGTEVLEFLIIEMNNETRRLQFLRGNDVLPSQITVY